MCVCVCVCVCKSAWLFARICVYVYISYILLVID